MTNTYSIDLFETLCFLRDKYREKLKQLLAEEKAFCETLSIKYKEAQEILRDIIEKHPDMRGGFMIDTNFFNEYYCTRITSSFEDGNLHSFDWDIDVSGQHAYQLRQGIEYVVISNAAINKLCPSIPTRKIKEAKEILINEGKIEFSRLCFMPTYRILDGGSQ